MLSESFVISTSGSEKVTSGTVNNKESSIHIHEYQPFPGLRSSFKNSFTQPNCLAVSASHVFAAQTDKAVIHVYNRERRNQEAVVPFPEKITSLALIGHYDGAGTLVLGTEGGRVLLWELCTGRLVSTPQSHLQATTCLAIDPSYNFLLTGSADSSVHVWSIPALLSFSAFSRHDPTQASPYSPQRTLSNHRAGITALIAGHSTSSANIAISASRDNTCLVWDYRSGTLLHTFLVPATPLCLAVDPADRAFYAGYEDGSIQLVDFYKRPAFLHPIYDPELCATPTQPPTTDRWSLLAEAASTALCLEVSYDGTTLFSGHQNGKVHTWDIAKGRYGTQLADVACSITNICMLPPAGFPKQRALVLKLLNVVKPRYENSFRGSNLSLTGSGVPDNYTFTAHFASIICLSSAANDARLSFESALTHCSFPADLLDKGLAQLATFSSKGKGRTGGLDKSQDGDDTDPTETETLKAQLRHARAMQTAHMEHAIELGDELLRIQDAERRKRRLRKLGRLKRANLETSRRKREMGEVVEKGQDDMEVDGDKTEAEESSSTEELTGSE